MQQACLMFMASLVLLTYSSDVLSNSRKLCTVAPLTVPKKSAECRNYLEDCVDATLIAVKKCATFSVWDKVLLQENRMRQLIGTGNCRHKVYEKRTTLEFCYVFYII